MENFIKAIKKDPKICKNINIMLDICLFHTNLDQKLVTIV